ncbi:DUF4224 domain-containing protein [Pseudomonas gingeri]|uniref:DUF4224 domain-containing protein n=1 Tax=Pseudomonas gingeri TaxID=117681 RepID=UPI0015A1CB25|nr:DUF4224 domain-containing protein [Pseudomonas gingeri]NVZ73592.1 DUF4224 domain-containing protein [Pseudomonas gingeri]
MSDPSESMFISQQDVAELTGHPRPAIQARWLRANAIPFIIGGDGRPKVARQSLLSKLDPAQPDPELPIEPMPSLVEITDWDKVSEALMAELIGATSRALQGRRSRGAIPPDIWREVDGRIMYSLKRYDAWLEGHWPPFEEPTPTKRRKPAPKDKRRNIQLLV